MQSKAPVYFKYFRHSMPGPRDPVLIDKNNAEPCREF
jgi:hypothetical protein